MRMKRSIRWRTQRCIKCGAPAKQWGGVVRFNENEWVLAGWCLRCKNDNWYHGDYSPRMGRESSD